MNSEVRLPFIYEDNVKEKSIFFLFSPLPLQYHGNIQRRNEETDLQLTSKQTCKHFQNFCDLTGPLQFNQQTQPSPWQAERKGEDVIIASLEILLFTSGGLPHHLILCAKALSFLSQVNRLWGTDHALFLRSSTASRTYIPCKDDPLCCAHSLLPWEVSAVGEKPLCSILRT